ncbi:hypothetical protein K2173_006941 [Erythroxylum novogranatense]|uniref:Barwin domain-containing protein n=1 Tax=Erythroxylum novogranatense TaxID=1862640 RepID=A0AAV8SZS7_9ROSI|nr:hypothetical protein K2173_006941 [Erythroxylum novogranatense]
MERFGLAAISLLLFALSGIVGGHHHCWGHHHCEAEADATAGDSDKRFVNATKKFYNPEKIGWDLNAANAFCKTWNANKPLSWRQKYGWASFCAQDGLKDQPFCGKCLKVTNPATGKQVLARIVDRCNNGGMELDVSLFKKLANNQAGNAESHYMVKYDFVDCRD